MIALLLPLVASVALGLGSPAPAHVPSTSTRAPVAPRVQQYEALTAKTLGLFSGELASACGLSFLQHSPSGRYLVAASDIWRETTAARTSFGLVVVDQNCSSGGGRPCAFVVEALGGTRAVSWSRDEQRLYVIEEDKNLVEISVDFAKLVPARTTGRTALPGVAAAAITSTDRTSSSSIQEEALRILKAFVAASDRARTDQSIMGFYLNGHRSAALLESSKSLDTEVLVPDARLSAPFPGPLLRHAQLSDVGAHSALLSDIGLREWLGAGRSERGAISYERTIVSTATGRAIGSWAPDGFKAAGTASSDPVAILNRRLQQEGGELIGGSLADGGGFAAVVRNLDGTVTIEARRAGRSSIAHCPQQKGPTLSLHRRLDIGIPGRKLDVSHLVPTGRSRGLAVYFAGGPGAGIQSAPEDFVVRSFLERGYSVLAVNYSGTALGGLPLFERLRHDGVKALREDAKAVARWLRLRPAANKDPVIVGASLGALPALAVDAELGAAAHRLVLITPYLAHRDPAEWHKPASVPYQRSFEARLLGVTDAPARARLQRDMNALQAGRSSAPVFVAFGTQDTVSKPQDLLLKPKPTDRVLSVPATHGFAAASPELWRELVGWMEASREN